MTSLLVKCLVFYIPSVSGTAPLVIVPRSRNSETIYTIFVCTSTCVSEKSWFHQL